MRFYNPRPFRYIWEGEVYYVSFYQKLEHQPYGFKLFVGVNYKINKWHGNLVVSVFHYLQQWALKSSGTIEQVHPGFDSGKGKY